VAGRSIQSLDRFRGNVRSVDEVYAAFSGAKRPSAQEIPDHDPGGDLEREEIRDLLAPYAAREVPDEELARYPLHTMFPFLSAASYRYYMPRFIEHCLEPRAGSLLPESLLFALAHSNDHRIASFSANERAVVLEYLEDLASQTESHIHVEGIRAAQDQWREAV
jgi:hypothetical protein